MNALAQLYAMRGDFDRARTLYRRGRATLEDLGATVQATAVSIYSGRVELLASDPVAAEERMRPAYDTFRKLGERATCSTLAAILGEAVYQQGRYDEADALSHVSEEIASPDDFDAQYRWRALRAKIHVRNGDVPEAETIAREGVRIVQQSDSPVEQADALLALAAVLRQSGRSDESLPITAQALQLYDAKGDLVSAEPSADDWIAAHAGEHAPYWLVTSDRELRQRVGGEAERVLGGGAFVRELLAQ